MKPSRKKGKKAPNLTSKRGAWVYPQLHTWRQDAYFESPASYAADGYESRRRNRIRSCEWILSTVHRELVLTNVLLWYEELHKKKLKTENGKVTAQARMIIAHAKKSAGLPDHDLDVATSNV